MQSQTHDPEAVALSKIYALLIRKSNERKQQQTEKKVTADTATNTGLDNRTLSKMDYPNE